MFLTRKFKPELFFPPPSPSARPISSWCWFWFLGLKDGNRSGMNFLTGENGRMYLELRNDLTPVRLVTQVLGPSNVLAGWSLSPCRQVVLGWVRTYFKFRKLFPLKKTFTFFQAESCAASLTQLRHLTLWTCEAGTGAGA